MKNLVFTFLLVLFVTFNTNAQQNTSDATIEKNLTGIQLGFIGVWAYNEARLTDQLALRTELGLSLGVSWRYGYDPDYGLAPRIALAPRYYYNLSNRLEKSKNISKNSGNFISLPVIYVPDLLVWKTNEQTYIINQMIIAPTWGIRRVYNHFEFESGIGLGIIHYFPTREVFTGHLTQTYLNIVLSIGYSF